MSVSNARPACLTCPSLPLRCRLYSFEAVGLLLGQEEVPAQEQHACLAALLQPLLQQVRPPPHPQALSSLPEACPC